mmetsp:Transcript_17748/g.26887  ORF Transcript_17748/g.26887 Transcript_17748/m.26887 type:complete len:385 (-) Transcript_17748:168-1322(-)
MQIMFALLLHFLSVAIIFASAIDFNGWLKLHEKSYHSTEEYIKRIGIFHENQAVVERHNAAFEDGLTSYSMTMDSPFADMSADEFASSYLMESQHCSATTHRSSGRLRPIDAEGEKTLLKSIDWRTKGIMTPVKNQGHCGSCWTFSTTGCLEAHTCLVEEEDCTNWRGLAEQQLVDCAGKFNNNGCNGGLPSQAYEYIKYTGRGLDLEDTYKYVANETDGICKANAGKVGAQVADVYNITSRDEEDLMHAISTLGPVSVAYQVSPDFRLYKHGVYDSYNATTNQTMCNNTNMDVNHAVVAVGLGQTGDADEIPFYIIRNSWGTSWGMEGHFWMKRGENLCGVSDCASFPLVPRRLTATEKKKRNDANSGMFRGVEGGLIHQSRH